MISIPNSTPPLFLNRINPNSLLHFTSPPSFIFFNKSSSKSLIRALKTESDGDKVVETDPFGPDLLKKPRISSLDVGESATTTKNERFSDERDFESEDNKRGGEDDDWVDWEDQILEDTVPLVGFVRMLLHSGKFGGHFYAKFSSGPNHCIHGHALRAGSGYRHGYLFNVNISSTRKCANIMYGSGDRLSPDHEKTILERLLPYHPDFERKIGCGVDYIKVDYHPDFADSRCLFIVRKDGESVDFSYWKCIKGLIKKNYPHYADSFILRHFRRRSSRNE